MICDYRPSNGSVLGMPCQRCKHLVDLHLGCDKCPVCLLLAHLANFDAEVVEAISKHVRNGGTFPVRQYVERHPEWEACKS